MRRWYLHAAHAWFVPPLPLPAAAAVPELLLLPRGEVVLAECGAAERALLGLWVWWCEEGGDVVTVEVPVPVPVVVVVVVVIWRRGACCWEEAAAVAAEEVMVSRSPRRWRRQWRRPSCSR